MDEGEEEEFAMLVRKVGKLFYKKGIISNFRRARSQSKNDGKKEEMGLCYHCKKTRHLITDCPYLQATTLRKVHKKKVMMTTWDDSKWGDSKIESDEKVDTAHMLHG